MSTTPHREVLVLGGYGAVGTGIVDAALADPTWRVVTASRRAAPSSLLNGAPPPRHVQVDLLNKGATKNAFESLTSITDVVFTAFVDAATPAASVAPNVDMLSNALHGLLDVGAKLKHVVLIAGGKAYGPQLGHYKTPAKESDPRIMGPNFYYDQEDFLKEFETKFGVTWTVLRPDGIFGPSLGSPMNLVNGMAVFAAISKELNIPLRFPGSLAAWNALHEATDAGLLGKASLWSLGSDNAAGEIFNVVNGDHFRWSQIWNELAKFYDMPVMEPQPMSLTSQMADKGPIWDKIVAKYGLQPTPFAEIAAWPFLDGIFNIGYDLIQSTIKIRQAGFHDCIDTHDSLLVQLGRLRAAKLIP